MRREETGKTVMAPAAPEDFPVRCDEPLPGEDLTYVLYGSGGCSLYDAAKLRALGGVDEAYEPAYVEDLDLGYRAWQRGWPSVYVAGRRGGAPPSRHHLALSTAKTQLERLLEVNYLKFLARCRRRVPRLFRRLWGQALRRLRAAQRRPLCGRPARHRAGRRSRAEPPVTPRELFLALTGGAVAVFPGPPGCRANHACWWPARTCRSRSPTAAPSACTT